MRLTVKTRHEATDRQRQMIAEYIERDNRELINEFEEANVFYRLTLAGSAFLQSISTGQGRGERSYRLRPD